MKYSFRWLALIAIGLLVPHSAWARASLVIYPTIVLFDGSSRSASVNVMNRGDTAGTFEISLVDFSMTPEGGLQKLEEAPLWSVRPYIRYSPRRTTLQPGEDQLIKIALRPQPEVPNGEYYAHIRVLTLDDSVPEVEGDPDLIQTTTSVAIKTRAALAIPIIWRNSEDKPAASIHSVEFDEAGNQLLVTVRRTGTVSLRGYVHVVAPSAVGEPTAVSAPAPVIIYPNIDTRVVSVPFDEGVDFRALTAGAMVLVSSDIEIPDASSTLASHQLPN